MKRRSIGGSLKRVIVLTLALVILLSVLTPAASAWREAPSENPFIDVHPHHWHHDYVSWAWINGVTTGTSPTTFAPDSSVTRGQFATFLWRIAGRPHVNPTHRFTDVPTGMFFTTAVAWAHANNIVEGLNPTTFAPNSPITREQLAAMLFRYIRYIEGDTSSAPGATNRFNDSGSISQWARGYMNWAAYQGILGVGTSSLNPRGNARRSETVATLKRVVDMFSIDAPPDPPPPPPPTPQPILLEYDTLTEGSLTETAPIVTYRLEVPSAGRVTINLTRPATGGFPNNGADVRWLDASTSLLVTNQIGSGAFTRFVDLEAGTYFIEVARRGTNTGNFFITANFAAAENDPRVVNNTIHNAQPLPFEQSIAGFLSHQNMVDIYKIELTQPGRVTVNLTRPTIGGFPNGTATTNAGTDVRWLNVNSTQIIINKVGSGAFTRFMDLEAGTYFIEVSRGRVTDTGRYFIIANFTASGRTATSPINTIATAQQLSFGENVTGYLTHQEGVNMFRFTVPAGSNRQVTVSLTRPTVGGFPNGTATTRTGADVVWLDINGIQITRNQVGSGTFNNSRSLAPGTYYIEIAKRNTFETGIYNLVINMP